MQRALDELHDAKPHAVAEHTHGHAESGSCLALAGARVDDQQAFFDGRVGLLLFMAFAPAFGHALVRLGIGLHGRSCWMVVTLCAGAVDAIATVTPA